MGRSCKEERQGQGEGRGSWHRRPHPHHCAGARPAGARPRGGATGRGKGSKTTMEKPAPSHPQGRSDTHCRRIGVCRVWALQVDDPTLLPPVWRGQAHGSRQPQRQAPQATVYTSRPFWQPLPRVGCRRAGKGPPETSPKITFREHAAARAESLEKALQSITEGGDPALKLT